MYMNIKELFEKAENGTLTYEQFKQLADEAKCKFADLSTGEYVSRAKYEDDVTSRDDTITELQNTVQSRNTDISSLQEQLNTAGNDVEKLNTLSKNFADLQTKYDNDTKAFEAKLERQAYEFAVKDYANSKKFTSSAAKRDFIGSMIAENLKFDKDKGILGADDFTKNYTESNQDAFVVDDEAPTKPTPTIVASTSNTDVGGNTNEFKFNWF